MLTGAMTSAAEAIHVTQPAVSRLVRDLEQQLGLVLFHRRGNAVVPTADAHALLAEVERSFVGLARIREFAEQVRTGRGGSLRIAAMPAMAAGFVPRFVAQFCRNRPAVRVAVEGLPSTAIRDCVTAGQYDLGISGLRFRRDAFKIHPLDDYAVVAMPVGHRLAKLDEVKADDLQDEDVILLTKFINSHHPIEVALQAVRFKPVAETALSTIACSLVSEGMGVAVVDPFSASEFVGRNVVLRPFVPRLNIGTAIIHSIERPLSSIAQEFLSAFLARTRQFITQASYIRP